MSNTKEDIIRQEYEKYFSCQKYDTSVNRKLNLEYFSPAMDEYAKQVAIDFWKFCIKNNYKLTLAADEIFAEFLKQYNQ